MYVEDSAADGSAYCVGSYWTEEKKNGGRALAESWEIKDQDLSNEASLQETQGDRKQQGP